MRQPELREPRLRFPAGAARLAIRRFGSGELPAEPEELGLPVVRDPRGRIHGLDETPAGSARLLEGGRPGPAQLQDLRSMDEAASGEGDEIALLVDPLCQRKGPLACASDLKDLLAGEDHAAVDDADDEWGQIRRRHRHHRFVEKGETFLDAPCAREHVALGMQAQSEEIAVAEAFADRGRLAGDFGRSFEVPAAS